MSQRRQQWHLTQLTHSGCGREIRYCLAAMKHENARGGRGKIAVATLSTLPDTYVVRDTSMAEGEYLFFNMAWFWFGVDLYHGHQIQLYHNQIYHQWFIKLAHKSCRVLEWMNVYWKGSIRPTSSKNHKSMNWILNKYMQECLELRELILCKTRIPANHFKEITWICCHAKRSAICWV